MLDVKTPAGIEIDEEMKSNNQKGPPRPHDLLAQSLVEILKQPLKFASNLASLSPLSDDLKIKSDQLVDFIMNRFVTDVASSIHTVPFYNYVIPSLRNDEEFPRNLLLCEIDRSSKRDGRNPLLRSVHPNVCLLSTIVKLYDDVQGKIKRLVVDWWVEARI